MTDQQTKPRVYLETTVISYLVARASRDLITAAHQQATREWWERRRTDFEMYSSLVTEEEAGAGDAEAARLRLELLSQIPMLDVGDDVAAFARALVLEVPLPAKAATDALHIAAATIHGMHYLVTWNCSHIANAVLRPRIEAVCRNHGYEPPVIATPEELMEE